MAHKRQISRMGQTIFCTPQNLHIYWDNVKPYIYTDFLTWVSADLHGCTPPSSSEDLWQLINDRGYLKGFLVDLQERVKADTIDMTVGSLQRNRIVLKEILMIYRIIRYLFFRPLRK